MKKPATRRSLSFVLGGVGALVALGAVTGCGPVNQPSAPAASTAAGGSVAPAPTPSGGSGQQTPGVGQEKKPSPDTLRPALADYFHDSEGLDPQQAQKAATCAMYPAFQELSAASLKAIVKEQPSKIRSADRKVFGDVVTECETAAR